jgi:hypothetical protein
MWGGMKIADVHRNDRNAPYEGLVEYADNNIMFRLSLSITNSTHDKLDKI